MADKQKAGAARFEGTWLWWLAFGGVAGALLYAAFLPRFAGTSAVLAAAGFFGLELGLWALLRGRGLAQATAPLSRRAAVRLTAAHAVLALLAVGAFLLMRFDTLDALSGALTQLGVSASAFSSLLDGIFMAGNALALAAVCYAAWRMLRGEAWSFTLVHHAFSLLLYVFLLRTQLHSMSASVEQFASNLLAAIFWYCGALALGAVGSLVVGRQRRRVKI